MFQTSPSVRCPVTSERLSANVVVAGSCVAADLATKAPNAQVRV